MDSDIEELYFQKLQEMVQDEDKIVTVASLASDLGISVKISQKLMKKYVEDQRKLDSDDLAITYVLTGLLKDNHGKGVFMVKEEDLDTKQSLFEDKPFKLIYSLQKNKNVDFNIIALVDMFDSTKIREKALEGSIVSKNCVKRILVQQPPPVPPPSEKVIQPKPGKSTEENKSVEKPESSKNTQKPKTSGNIANLFKAVAAKSSQTNGGKNSSTKSNSSKNSNKKSGGLTGFLISGATKCPKNANTNTTQAIKEEPKLLLNKKNSSSSNEAQDEIKQEELMEIFDDDFEKEVVKNTIKEKNKTVEETKVETKKPTRKRPRDKSHEKPTKRRKRIVERNDSDSDDLFGKEEDSEDIVDKSDDEPERNPSSVQEKPLPSKNRKRKAISKTYADEEGFVVTKVEYVYETASEDENEVPKPPKQEIQKTLEKPKPKANNKKKVQNQPSLMNFFKKV